MMSNNNNKFSAYLLLVLLTISWNAGATMTSASTAFGLMNASCPTPKQQYQEINQLKQHIISAKNLEEARQLAITPTEEALSALNNARSIMPFSDDLRSAEAKLRDKKQRIILASSQAQIAEEFDGMMLASLDNDRAAHVNIGSGSCNYSTGELIAIVVGLILGIIPGIILLVVLC
jgi:hypothetical protein